MGRGVYGRFVSAPSAAPLERRGCSSTLREHEHNPLSPRGLRTKPRDRPGLPSQHLGKTETCLLREPTSHPYYAGLRDGFPTVAWIRSSPARLPGSTARSGPWTPIEFAEG